MEPACHQVLHQPTLRRQPPSLCFCRVRFDVTLCPIAGPLSACVTQRTGGGRRLLATVADTAVFEGRTPFTT